MPPAMMTLRDAAALLRLSPGTLAVQARRGRLRARKVARDWIVSPAEVERYRREVLGKPGWPAKPEAAPTVDHLPGPTVELVTRAENVSGQRPDVPRFCPVPKPSQRRKAKR